MSWLDDYALRLIFLGFYLTILAYHAWTAKAETGGLSDFLVAGRGLGGWMIALSFYATFVSTNSFVGHAGKSWDVGLIWYIKGAVIVTCCYASWYMVAPRFYARALEYQSLTLPDFLGSRYSSLRLRRVSAVVILIAAIVYIVAVYKGSALALQQYLSLDYKLAVACVFVVVTAYTLAGGFKAVVLTDAIQGLLMLAGAVALTAAVIYQGGGLRAVLDSIQIQDPAMVSWEGNLPMMTILGLSLAGGMKMLVDPRQLSRIYGLKNERALRTARLVSPVFILITYVCVLPVGAFAHALIPAEAINDSDMVTPYLLGTLQVMGPVLSSLFLLVLLSAALSSLDSILLVASSSVSRDIRIVPDSDPKVLMRTRLWVLLISFAGMLGALNPIGGIVEITGFSGSLYAACFLPTLVVGLYWNGGTSAGAVSCVSVGALTVIGWYFAKLADLVTIHEVYVGTAMALVTYLAVSYVDSRSSAPSLLRSAIP